MHVNDGARPDTAANQDSMDFVFIPYLRISIGHRSSEEESRRQLPEKNTYLRIEIMVKNDKR